MHPGLLKHKAFPKLFYKLFQLFQTFFIISKDSLMEWTGLEITFGQNSPAAVSPFPSLLCEQKIS